MFWWPKQLVAKLFRLARECLLRNSWSICAQSTDCESQIFVVTIYWLAQERKIDFIWLLLYNYLGNKIPNAKMVQFNYRNVGLVLFIMVFLACIYHTTSSSQHVTRRRRRNQRSGSVLHRNSLTPTKFTIDIKMPGVSPRKVCIAP